MRELLVTCFSKYLEVKSVEIQNLSVNFIAGIPIKTTLSHELTNQYGYLATSIIKEVYWYIISTI